MPDPVQVFSSFRLHSHCTSLPATLPFKKHFFISTAGQKGQENFKAGVEDIVSEQSAVTVQPHPVRWSYSQLEFWRGPLSFFGFPLCKTGLWIKSSTKKGGGGFSRTGELPPVMYNMNAWANESKPLKWTGQVTNLAWARHWTVSILACSRNVFIHGCAKCLSLPSQVDMR